MGLTLSQKFSMLVGDLHRDARIPCMSLGSQTRPRNMLVLVVVVVAAVATIVWRIYALRS